MRSGLRDTEMDWKKVSWQRARAMGPSESYSKLGINIVVIPEPRKELRRRPQLFMVGIVPY